MPRKPQNSRREQKTIASLSLILLLWAGVAGAQPPHATPAPVNTPPPAAQTPMAPPMPAPGPGGPGMPAPGGATPTPAFTPPPAYNVPGAVSAPLAPGQTPTPTPRPAAPPQVLYEAQPTTASIRKTGGAIEEPAGGETLPTTAPESPKVTITVRQKTLEEIFTTIREKNGVRIKSMGNTGQTKMDLVVRDIPVEQLLQQIAIKNGWIWVQLADGSYEMHDKESFRAVQAQQVRIKSIQLHYIDAEELMKVVQPLLTPEIGAVAADARSNKIIVTDLPGKIALVDSIVKEYDIQVYTHVFEVKHAAMDKVSEQLDKVKSKAGEMFIDEVNRTIIVKDTFDKIKIMEQLVQILDRDVEMRVYNLMNIGVEGEAVEDFIGKFIEPLKSQSDTAIMEYNKESGKLFVRDVRSVQEKILQILRQVDTPRKQVRIEGEIVSVAVTHKSSIGVNWTISPHFDEAIRAGQAAATGLTGLSGTETAFNTVGLPIITGGKGGLTVLEMTEHCKAELNAALSDSRTRLLLRPRITIENNETGSIMVERNEPVLQTYNYGYGIQGNGVGSASSGQMTYTTGLRLNIRPYISNRGLIEMEVEIENTTPIIVPDIGGGVRGVGSSGESASTVMIVPSGETRVIGGLISRDNNDGTAGIPVLSQIPWIGWLFGEKTKDNTMRNLMFFITPTIIEELPLNDLLVEPVNEAAQASMQLAQQGATAAPTNINEIPPELRPYLKEIQPEALPMPGESLTTTTTGALAPLGAISDESPLATGTPSEGVGAPETMSGSHFLSNEPFTAAGPPPIEGELKMGGAIAQITGKTPSGPTGAFGGGAPGAPAPRGPAGAVAKAGAPAKAGTTTGKAGAPPSATPTAPTRAQRGTERTQPGADRGRGFQSSRYRGMQNQSYRGETRY